MNGARFRVRQTWGCIVASGIPGQQSSYVEGPDGRSRVFSYDEVLAYLNENDDPRTGVYLAAELIWERAQRSG